MSAMSTTAAGKAVRGAFRAVLGSQAGHKTDRAAFYEGYRVLMEKARAWDEISRALDENAVDRMSAADVAATGFGLQERLA